MKLYTDSKGTWAGTQVDAKKFGEFYGDYETVDVPTDKPTLLKFLNEYQVGADTTEYHTYDDEREKANNTTEKHHPQSCSANPNVWDVQDAVLNCDRKHLGAALGAIISRLHDEMEKA